jgi:hypothetical protein
MRIGGPNYNLITSIKAFIGKRSNRRAGGCRDGSSGKIFEFANECSMAIWCFKVAEPSATTNLCPVTF